MGHEFLLAQEFRKWVGEGKTAYFYLSNCYKYPVAEYLSYPVSGVYLRYLTHFHAASI